MVMVFFVVVMGLIHLLKLRRSSLMSLAPQLQTGDIVLFTGATSSGAVIRLFDSAEFSHVGLVSCQLVVTMFQALMYIVLVSVNVV